MYVSSTYKYLHNFRKPVENTVLKIRIVIKNGWSLKLRQHNKLMHHWLSCPLQACNQPWTKLHSPPVGCKED